MSETETNFDPETGEVVEPTKPEPTEPEPTEPEPEPTEPTPDEGQSLEAQAREQDEIWNTLNKKGSNYAKAVVAILEETPVSVAVCEMCADSIPGFRIVPPQDELRTALAQVVEGVARLEDLEEDPDAEQCPVCKGKGHLRIRTDVPQNKVRHCRHCNGAGFLDRTPQSGALQPPQPPPTEENGEHPVGVPVGDPDIEKVRARGFMVMPLPQLTNVGQ